MIEAMIFGVLLWGWTISCQADNILKELKKLNNTLENKDHG